MYKRVRLGAALTACAVVAGMVAPSAQAEPEAAPVDQITGSLVQIKTVVTGSIFVKFDVENSVEGWSSPITRTVVCAGVAVEATRVVTSASCTDPNSYAIASKMREQATKEILMRDGRSESAADTVSPIGAGQKWKPVADPAHPDDPADVTITVRGLGNDGGMVQATQQASTFGTGELTGAVSLLTLNSALDGLEPALFSDEVPTLGSTVFLAGPSSGSFDGPAPKAQLRKTDIIAMPTDDGKTSIELGLDARPQDMGGPVVDADGVVVGLMTRSDSPSGVEAASLHRYLAAKGVTFAEPAAPARSSSIWLWLGPVIAVAVLLVGLVAFMLLRRRRPQIPQTGRAPGQAEQLYPGQPYTGEFPGQPLPSQLLQGQPHPGQHFPQAPYPGHQPPHAPPPPARQ